jgi:molybdate transport system substrate-binding protein
MKTTAWIMAGALVVLPAIAAASSPATAPTTGPAVAAGITVYAAGSLTGALADIAKHYTAATGEPVRIVNGPAGLLRERIENGEAADIYISANMAHPEKLAAEGKATAPVVFTRNALCVQTLPDAGITSENLLDRLLAPGMRIGTSTPGADPGGDYAWQFFARAESVHPGARANLEAKAKKLVGGPVAPVIPGNVGAAKYFLRHHDVDVFFGYCSSHDATPDPDLRTVQVPANLSLPVDYGMSVVLRDGDPARRAASFRFALYAMSPAAQERLPTYGFRPVTAPEH